MRRPNPLGLFLALLLITAGCDGPTNPREREPEPEIDTTPGVHVIGALPSDTVMTVLAAPLTVEVRDAAGKVAAGVEVEFRPLDRPVPITRYPGRPAPRVLIGEPDSTRFTALPLVRTAGADGRAAVRVRFHTFADTGEVAVSVPSLGYRDTVRYVIRPGNPVRVVAAPRDSALYVGASYALRGVALDQWDNPRADAVAFSAGAGPVALEGTAVRGTAIGRAHLLARVGTLTDTLWVSVVPAGTMAGRTLKLTDPDRAGRWVIVQFGLDGSGYQPLLRNTAVDVDQFPAIRWSPQGDHLLMTGGDTNGVLKIFRVNLDGTARPLFNPPSPAFDLGGAYTSDGAWVYFSRSPRGERQEIDLYRARPDGTGAERISPDPTQWFYEDRNPDPSPDGRFVAYASNRDRDYNSGRLGNGYLRILDTQTWRAVSLNLEAYRPVWSPDGQWIAFQNGTGISIVRPDGSGLKTLAAQGYWHGTTWSPDGQWVAAAAINGSITLLSVDGRHTLPLGYTAGVVDPAWRPR